MNNPVKYSKRLWITTDVPFCIPVLSESVSKMTAKPRAAEMEQLIGCVQLETAVGNMLSCAIIGF
jgi:hypothetical protein